MSKAHDLSLEVAARLALITTANGYATDIGVRVYRGRRFIDPSRDGGMLPCVSIGEGDDNVIEYRPPMSARIAQRYVCEAVVRCDPDYPNDAAHAVIADMKRALWRGDQTFGNRVRSLTYAGRSILPRADGADVVAAAVMFDVEFAEKLGEP